MRRRKFMGEIVVCGGCFQRLLMYCLPPPLRLGIEGKFNSYPFTTSSWLGCSPKHIRGQQVWRWCCVKLGSEPHLKHLWPWKWQPYTKIQIRWRRARELSVSVDISPDYRYGPNTVMEGTSLLVFLYMNSSYTK